MARERRTERRADLGPEPFDLKSLPRAIQAELRGLTQEKALKVGEHLAKAGAALDTDPELAFAHADRARELAPRLPVVREAVAESAYAAGEFGVALAEYRALRRITGADDFLAVMADCERAAGRHREALKLLTELESAEVDPDTLVEGRIVAAGVRSDMGESAEGVRLLRQLNRSPVPGSTPEARARAAYAFADALAGAGDPQARDWFIKAQEIAPGATDADDRIDALDGIVLELDESDEDEE